MFVSTVLAKSLIKCVIVAVAVVMAVAAAVAAGGSFSVCQLPVPVC